MIDPGASGRVGTTHLQLGRLGLGTAPLGNLYATVSEADAAATLAAAQRHGIHWFDTAPLYGHGLAETRLGKFVRQGASLQRVVSTKVGRVLEPAAHAQPPAHFVAPLPYQPVFDYSRGGIERSFEESLG